MKKRGRDKTYTMAKEILRYYYDGLNNRNEEWKKFEKRK